MMKQKHEYNVFQNTKSEKMLVHAIRFGFPSYFIILEYKNVGQKMCLWNKIPMLIIVLISMK